MKKTNQKQIGEVWCFLLPWTVSLTHTCAKDSASSSSARPTLLILAIRPQALRILNTGMPKTPVCVLGVPTRERSQSLHPASHEGAC